MAFGCLPFSLCGGNFSRVSSKHTDDVQDQVQGSVLDEAAAGSAADCLSSAQQRRNPETHVQVADNLGSKSATATDSILSKEDFQHIQEASSRCRSPQSTPRKSEVVPLPPISTEFTPPRKEANKWVSSSFKSVRGSFKRVKSVLKKLGSRGSERPSSARPDMYSIVGSKSKKGVTFDAAVVDPDPTRPSPSANVKRICTPKPSGKFMWLNSKSSHVTFGEEVANPATHNRVLLLRQKTPYLRHPDAHKTSNTIPITAASTNSALPGSDSPTRLSPSWSQPKLANHTSTAKASLKAQFISSLSPKTHSPAILGREQTPYHSSTGVKDEFLGGLHVRISPGEASPRTTDPDILNREATPFQSAAAKPETLDGDDSIKSFASSRFSATRSLPTQAIPAGAPRASHRLPPALQLPLHSRSSSLTSDLCTPNPAANTPTRGGARMPVPPDALLEDILAEEREQAEEEGLQADLQLPSRQGPWLQKTQASSFLKREVSRRSLFSHVSCRSMAPSIAISDWAEDERDERASGGSQADTEGEQLRVGRTVAERAWPTPVSKASFLKRDASRRSLLSQASVRKFQDTESGEYSSSQSLPATDHAGRCNKLQVSVNTGKAHRVLSREASRKSLLAPQPHRPSRSGSIATDDDSAESLHAYGGHNSKVKASSSTPECQESSVYGNSKSLHSKELIPPDSPIIVIGDSYVTSFKMAALAADLAQVANMHGDSYEPLSPSSFQPTGKNLPWTQQLPKATYVLGNDDGGVGAWHDLNSITAPSSVTSLSGSISQYANSEYAPSRQASRRRFGSDASSILLNRLESSNSRGHRRTYSCTPDGIVHRSAKSEIVHRSKSNSQQRTLAGARRSDYGSFQKRELMDTVSRASFTSRASRLSRCTSFANIDDPEGFEGGEYKRSSVFSAKSHGRSSLGSTVGCVA